MRETVNPEPVTLESVLADENINAAWLQVKANDGAAGVDGWSVERSQAHLRAQWPRIKTALLAGQYQPAAVRAVTIPKANGGERTLGIPTVLDRVIQQAIQQKLGPVWEPDFSEYSYGFRPGRSAHDAVRTAQGLVQAGKQWVVDLDLRSFFDRVGHDRLMSQVAGRVRDKRLLRLIGDYLRAPLQRPDGRQEKRTQGTPQGGPLSPLLANIYLDPLDKELERRGLSFVRYADDIAIFVSSPRAAERVKASIIVWIERHLKVEVNRDKSRSGPSDQSGLLGFRLYADGRIGVAPKAIERLKTKVRELWEARQSLTSNQLREQWQRYSRGWWNYFQLADWRREVTNLSGWIRRHMRKCFWLRWHHPRGRRRALHQRGIRGRALGLASSRRGAWSIAKCPILQQALNNATLYRYGLIIPWASVPATQ